MDPHFGSFLPIGTGNEKLYDRSGRQPRQHHALTITGLWSSRARLFAASSTIGSRSLDGQQQRRQRQQPTV